MSEETQDSLAAAMSELSDSQIGGDQSGLEIVPGLGIDPIDAQQFTERPGQHIVARGQTPSQPGKP